MCGQAADSDAKRGVVRGSVWVAGVVGVLTGLVLALGWRLTESDGFIFVASIALSVVIGIAVRLRVDEDFSWRTGLVAAVATLVVIPPATLLEWSVRPVTSEDLIVAFARDELRERRERGEQLDPPLPVDLDDMMVTDVPPESYRDARLRLESLTGAERERQEQLVRSHRRARGILAEHTEGELVWVGLSLLLAWSIAGSKPDDGSFPPMP